MRFTSLIILLAFAFTASGADRYIRFDTGSDAAAGSMAAPWKHHPDDNNATGNAAAFTPAPGDTFFFYAGVTYTGTVNWRNSGTPGNPITYDGTSWGVAGQRSTNTTAFATGTSAFQTGTGNMRSNIFMHGFFVHQVGGFPYNSPRFSGPPNSIWRENGSFGAGVFFDGPPRDIIISNNIFTEIGHWTNVIQNSNYTAIQGGGVVFNGGGTNNLVISNKFSKMQIPIKLATRVGQDAISNIFWGNTISNNVNWGIDFASGGTGSRYDGNRIIGGYIGSMNELDQANWKGGGDAPHQNQIVFFNNETPAYWGTNNYIDGVHMSTDTSLPGGGTAGIFFSRGSSAIIQNCTFVNLQQPYTISIGHANTVPEVQHVYIRNNTFYQGRLTSATETSAAKRRVYINNNIFRMSGQISSINIQQNYNILASLDGNLYYNSTVAQNTWNAVQLAGLDTSAKFAELQNYGYEANGAYGQPQFVSTSQPFRDADMHLVSGSPGIGMGVNNTNLVILDKARVPRAGNALTAGAYVFESTTPGDTTPPTPNPLTWVEDPRALTPTSITMTYSAATDDSGDPVSYSIFEYTGNPGCNGTSSTSDTTYIDTDVTPNTTCEYRVIAIDSSGNETTVSDPRSVTTPTEVPPPLFSAQNVRFGILNVVGPDFTTQPTNLFYYNAEGGGTPDGYTDFGVVNWDYGAEVYAGTNVFMASDSTNTSSTTVTFAPQTAMTVIGAIRRNSVSGTPRQIASFTDGVTEQFGLLYSTNGLMIRHGTVTNTVPLYSPQNNWYLYRVSYQAGSGANGLLYAEWATNTIFTAGATNRITTGTATGSVSSATWGHPAGLPGNRFLFDETWGKPGYQSITGNSPLP